MNYLLLLTFDLPRPISSQNVAAGYVQGFNLPHTSWAIGRRTYIWMGSLNAQARSRYGRKRTGARGRRNRTWSGLLGVGAWDMSITCNAACNCACSVDRHTTRTVRTYRRGSSNRCLCPSAYGSHTLTHTKTQPASARQKDSLQGRHRVLGLAQVNRIWPMGLYYKRQQSCSGCVFLLNMFIVEVAIVFKRHA